MSAWKDLLKEPYKKTAISRLAWACETGDGIDQHASEDILEIAAELAEYKKLPAALAEAMKIGDDLQHLYEAKEVEVAQLRAALDEARKVIEYYVGNGSMDKPGKEWLEAHPEETNG